MIDNKTSNVATANMVGLICSRIPDHIWRGMVRCSGLARNSTATTSSKEVMNAKKTFQKYKWPLIDVTRKSVEETAASIIKIHEIYLNNVK